MNTIEQTPFQLLKPLDGLHIEVRCWYRRGPGGTYHKSYVYANGKCIGSLSEQYGSENVGLDRALRFLQEEGYYVTGKGYLGTLFLRETLKGTYSTVNVSRERDL